MTIKDKIIKKFQEDNDLLYSTLRTELIDHKVFDNITVFDNEDDTITSLENWFKDDFINSFDKERTEKWFTYNPETKVVSYYNSLETALSDALNQLDSIAEYICDKYLNIYPRAWLEVLNEVLAEDEEE